MVRKKLADLLWNYPGDRPRESRETGIPAHPWVVIMIHNHILIWNIKLPFHFLGQTYIGHKASLICLLFETMQLYWKKNIYLLVFFSSLLTSEDTSFTQILLVPGIGSTKWKDNVPGTVFALANLSLSFSFHSASTSSSPTHIDLMFFSLPSQKLKTSRGVTIWLSIGHGKLMAPRVKVPCAAS